MPMGRSRGASRWTSTVARTSTRRATLQRERRTWATSEPSALVRPLSVIDFSEKCVNQPDAVLEVEDLLAHEALHGTIATGAAVFLRTEWPGLSDTLRFPGFGVDAATFLAVERGVAGLGIDTLGIDPGCAADFPVHRDVTLPRGIWHVENLTNLAAVPPIGAWVAVGVPRIAGASGFPARVFALLPQIT